MMKATLDRSFRRRLLISIAFGTTATAAGLLAKLRSQFPKAEKGSRDGSPAAREQVMDAAIKFMSRLFGHQLTAEDRHELLERLEFAVAHEPKRLWDYADLKRYLDDRARERGAVDFLTSGSDDQDAILDKLMTARFSRWQVELLREFPGRAGRYHRIVTVIIPGLSWLYANSGVTWRARGYERWQGIPGDWREVLAPGKSLP